MTANKVHRVAKNIMLGFFFPPNNERPNLRAVSGHFLEEVKHQTLWRLWSALATAPTISESRLRNGATCRDAEERLAR